VLRDVACDVREVLHVEKEAHRHEPRRLRGEAVAVGNGSMHRWLALAVEGGELSAHGRVAVSTCMQGRSSVAIKGGELSAHGIGALGEAPW
jgi:hypothetical protein